MGVIKKFNPETNRWEIYGSTDAKDIKLIDVGNNFETKNVESALREMSEKLNESIAYIEAHSQTLTEHTENIEWLIVNGGGGSGGGGGGGGTPAPPPPIGGGGGGGGGGTPETSLVATGGAGATGAPGAGVEAIGEDGTVGDETTIF